MVNIFVFCIILFIKFEINMSLGKPVIKLVDMDDEMKGWAINEAQKALEASSSEKLVATFMKSTFERRYKGVWHCIAGRNFGGFVTDASARSGNERCGMCSSLFHVRALSMCGVYRNPNLCRIFDLACWQPKEERTEFTLLSM